MEVLRTPDERFSALPDWPYEPRYAEVGDGLRAHYVDEGPRDGEPVLLLHGEPTWGYLYRHMIPPLAAAGLRVVVPDLIGFGRSDKPAAQADYTYARHVEWMRALLFDHLSLSGVTLFGQDWGGLIGLRLVGEHPDRFARVVAGNTFLPTGDHEPSEAFLAWQRFSQETPEFPIGRIVNGASKRELSEAEVAAYDAPFPEESYKAGARRFPMLVPTSPEDPAAEDNRKAWETLSAWDKPFLCTFSDGDPITAGGDRVFRKLVPGTAGMAHRTVSGGHFLQEDSGPELAAAIVELISG
ncbi:MAG TPA: haloalkane dehalogenase [Egibacteraceae bacterium]|nr:haloalkane dehalogenase [Egibacteraceae bacterium]